MNRKIELENKIKKALNNKPSSLNVQANKPKEVKVIGKKGGVKKSGVVRPVKPPVVNTVAVENVSFPHTDVIEYQVPDWFKSCENPEVSIIIPLYKSKNELLDFVNSWDFDEQIKTEIIYVDDGCPQLTYLEIVKAWNTKLASIKNGIGKIFVHTKNSGYGAACNTGAKYASGKYLIFLNADTYVTKGWIYPLVDLLKKDDSIGLVGNLQYRPLPNGEYNIDSMGSEWLWGCGSFLHVGRDVKHMSPAVFEKSNLKPEEREMVTGCCFIISKELFNKVGGFDPYFRVGYWEDSDLCMKVRYYAGKKVYFHPDSRIFHKGQHSGATAHGFVNNNKRLFYSKWVNCGAIDELVNDKRSFRLESILLQRNAAHGDVLVASSLAAAIKRKFPRCRVGFRTALPHVLLNNPFIDVLDVKCDPGQFQVFYNLDLAYEKRLKTHILQAYCETVGVKPENCKLYMYTESSPVVLPAKYTVIAAGRTAWVGRNWSVEKFNEVADYLKSQGHYIVNIGSGGDGEIKCADIDLRGKTSIYQLAGIIKNSSLFVGIDSFPFWLAQTFNIPGVAFFGCVSPELRIINKNMKYVKADIDCIGCHHENIPPCLGTSFCKKNFTYCEDLVKPQDFIKKIEELKFENYF